jgi:CubicO group peptidase (beta-lactamase class C family)
MSKHLAISTLIPLFFSFGFAQVKTKPQTIVSSIAEKEITRLDGSRISFTDIDKTIKQLMEAGKVTGLELAIINNNKIAYLKTYGYKNKSKNQFIDSSTVFYGASFSKAVFAYIAMQLVQEGVLELDKRVWSYLNKPLPLYKGYNNLTDDERWKQITVRHCLTHTTGFPNWRWLNPHGNNKLEIFFTPGERYAYSGEGLVLLQLAIEETTKKSIEQLAQERVFKPFGMTHTSYVWQKEFENNFAYGYDEKGDSLQKNRRTVPNAAGSMETTIVDYARFIEGVMQGKGLQDSFRMEMLSPQIAIKTKHQFPSLNTDTLEDAYKNIDLCYGLGWGLFKCPYGKAFFKEGHDDGWEHYNVNFPDKKTSIIIMSNSSNVEGIFKETLEKIIGDVYTPWEWENYIPYTNMRLVAGPPKLDTSITQYIGVYEADSVKANITIEQGVLQIELAKGGMPKTALHMDKLDLFSLNLAAIQIQFLRDENGKVDRLLMHGANEQHEFKKINKN